MSWTLVTFAVVLIGAAVAIQVAYLRGLARAGVELNRATKVVSYTNIALLVAASVGLVAYAAYVNLTAKGA